MNSNDADNEDMKHRFTRYGDEFEKITKRSLQVSAQGFRAFLLLALEKIKHREIKIEPSISSTQTPLRLNVLYQFAAYLGQRFGCRYVIDVGCGYVENLVQLYPQFKIIGINFDRSPAILRERYEFVTWTECNDDLLSHTPLPLDILRNSIIICVDAIGRSENPTSLLENLKNWLDNVPVCILSIPEKDLISRRYYLESRNPLHLRKWNLAELEHLICSKGFNLVFMGSATDSDHDYEKNTIVAVIEKNMSMNSALYKTPNEKVPTDFRVVAFVPVYNEEDIIVPSIKHMIEQGTSVYIIDNWSTDSTYDLAKQFEGKGLVGIERFPKEGPSQYYHWKAILRRIETLTKEIRADWFIFQDADEIRKSPWEGVSYRDGIYKVDRAGFNCIDHTVIGFFPVDNDFMPGSDFEKHFKYFAFGRSPNAQVKTWKNLGQSVSLSESGGHHVRFEGHRLYPYKFVIKHYRIRSQQHGEKKVFLERKPRWDPEEKVRGWHIQYDKIKEGHVFLRKPSELEIFDEIQFNRKYLVERLSGIGITPLKSER